ncbi:hypothetical protein C4M98_03765 [Mycoplasmopsis pullorum]|uniref:hypothetical protein n=1 Tax=Mycoplasmopsis pullorum TaxID=48003 RepID=UPI00111B0C3F|nr:hypothetical protein [Mycoplasmopsis pullorum]TNK82135.1 hypothetical protein C4M94_01880 [Mycoplasmopsis pullorum]TNK82474.1 hypothetical protein C4M80_02925 [Mycoplasmopsis pullorum]TNK84947.1 hypothetical protein C4M92_02700 [Mycoplasmopsis pullorum]TNK85104.1 hypothetical protein C4M81_00310 [Mycoplasmopsis pullorum]TNK86158.1 hypothetical protein C4M85_01030 [Mycoplasmopsis pullorum]
MKINDVYKKIQDAKFVRDLNGYNIREVEMFRQEILLILENEIKIREDLENKNESLFEENKKLKNELDKLRFEQKRSESLKKKKE